MSTIKLNSMLNTKVNLEKQTEIMSAHMQCCYFQQTVLSREIAHPKNILIKEFLVFFLTYVKSFSTQHISQVPEVCDNMHRILVPRACLYFFLLGFWGGGGYGS